jgi:hypothetical protein
VKQDRGSKPNIEELEVVNLEKEGEKLKEVKIGPISPLIKKTNSLHC